MADNCSCLGVWDRNDYKGEAEKQLSDENISQDVNSSDRQIRVDKSNKMFRKLKSQGKITEKEVKYFRYEYQKGTSLAKMCLLPKVHVPVRSVISNCGTTTGKISEFLNFHLTLVMQSNKSYIKASGDLVKKSRTFSISQVMSFLLQRAWLGYTLQFPTILYLKSLKTSYIKEKTKIYLLQTLSK